MRRAAFLLTSVLFLIVIGATVAGAQVRDPFQPLVTSDGSPVQRGDAANRDPFPPNPVPGPDNPGDRDLPFTGSDPSGWVVLSYGLIAAGVTTILVARARRPISFR